MKFRYLISLLVFLLLGLTAIYLLNNYPLMTPYIWKLRTQKLAAYVVVVLAIVPSTIAFQTLFRSNYLSPNVLGMDSIYTLSQTVFFFFMTQVMNQANPNVSIWTFLIQLALMLGFTYFIYRLVFPLDSSGERDDTLLIMLGLILSQLIKSLSVFMQVIMDPNDYENLFSRLNPSFQRISTNLLIIGLVITLIGTVYLFKHSKVLDVIKLGSSTAMSLGVDVQSVSKRLLFLIVILIGTSTAIIGPLTFLGFMIANITYRMTASFQHWQYFTIGILLGLCFVIGGQWLSEVVLNNHYNLSMVIDVVGAFMFFVLLLRGGRAYQTY